MLVHVVSKVAILIVSCTELSLPQVTGPFAPKACEDLGQSMNSCHVIRPDCCRLKLVFFHGRLEVLRKPDGQRDAIFP